MRKLNRRDGETPRTERKESWSLPLGVSASLRLILFLGLVFAWSCSVPNLAPQECIEARDLVREFYSFHFANDMHPTEENVRERERFLTRSFAAKLLVDARNLPVPTEDFFTRTPDFPKAFRVGECEVLEQGGRVQFDVLLFWKDDIRTEQRSIKVVAQKENDGWLIERVDR